MAANSCLGIEFLGDFAFRVVRRELTDRIRDRAVVDATEGFRFLFIMGFYSLVA